MIDFSNIQWILLILASFLIGISKSGIPVLSIVSVGIFSNILPIKESIAGIFLLFIFADFFAVWLFRKDVLWYELLKLIPVAFIGIVLGAIFIYYVDDIYIKKVIGLVLLILSIYSYLNYFKVVKFNNVYREHSSKSISLTRTFYGILGGFTSIVTNAGGTAMSLYLIKRRIPVKNHIAIVAWFFFSINLIKLVFLYNLNLITKEILILDSHFIPFVILGSLFGLYIAKKIPQNIFDPLVLFIILISSILLLV